MSIHNVVALLLSSAAGFFILGSVIGRWLERRDWNRLIQDNYLPKPPRRR